MNTKIPMEQTAQQQPKRRGRPPKQHTEPEPIKPQFIEEAKIYNPIKEHSVVQIVSSNNQNHGVLFIVGGHDETDVHGFFIVGPGEKKYITCKKEEVVVVGVATTRSMTPCSQEWINSHSPRRQSHTKE